MFDHPERSFQQLPAGDVLDPPTGEAGQDGDSWNQLISGGGPDINPELSGRLKFLEYDRMRKQDGTVKSLLWFLKLPIRGATWSLDPADETPEALAIRDCVAWNFGLEDQAGVMPQSWDRQTSHLLTALDFGPAFAEIVWGDLRAWTDADGDQHLIRPIVRLAPRMPQTIDRFDRNQDGSPKQLTQDVVGARPIPGEKLIYLTFDDEPGQWDGVSILRPAWFPWRLKRELMISAGIGWDRFSMGVPVVYHPDTEQGEQKAAEIGRSVRTHQRAYVRLPVPQGGSKDDSEWGLEILNAASSLADPTSLIRLCAEQIFEAGMLQFARQGMGQTGARASAETQAEPYYIAVTALARELARERRRQELRAFVKVNFGEPAADRWTPKLTVSRIQPRNVQVMSDAINLLSTAGFSFTDRDTQDDVRDLLGLTRLPNDLEQAHGISRDQVRGALAAVGVDEQTLAQVISMLPDDVGVAPMRGPVAEGQPLLA